MSTPSVRARAAVDPRTQWALDLFQGFVERWTPPAMHGHLADNDTNDGERVRAAIRAIAPLTDDERRVGWGVFRRTPDLTYDRERPSGFIYTLESAVFENPVQADNALAACVRRFEGVFVVCEIQQIQPRR